MFMNQFVFESEKFVPRCGVFFYHGFIIVSEHLVVNVPACFVSGREVSSCFFLTVIVRKFWVHILSKGFEGSWFEKIFSDDGLEKAHLRSSQASVREGRQGQQRRTQPTWTVFLSCVWRFILEAYF